MTGRSISRYPTNAAPEGSQQMSSLSGQPWNTHARCYATSTDPAENRRCRWRCSPCRPGEIRRSSKKVLAVNDFCSSDEDFPYPMGNVQMVGKSWALMYRGEAAGNAGGPRRSARAVSPSTGAVRRGHQLLPGYRRGEPVTHDAGQRASGGGPAARAARLRRTTGTAPHLGMQIQRRRRRPSRHRFRWRRTATGSTVNSCVLSLDRATTIERHPIGRRNVGKV